MKWNAYPSNILAREHVDTSLQSPIRLVQAELEPVIKRWAKDMNRHFSKAVSYTHLTLPTIYSV